MEDNQQDPSVELDKYIGTSAAFLITRPTPDKWVDKRDIRGGGQASYVKGQYFTQLLNMCFGFFWDYEVPEAFKEGNQIVAKGRLTVKVPGQRIERHFPDGTVEVRIIDPLSIVKEQFGGAEVKTYSSQVNDKNGKILHKAGDVIDLADDHKAAGTDALKKCCISGLGMFSDVYSRKVAKEGEVLSTSQMEAVYYRGEQAGMSKEETDKWIKEETGQNLKDMSGFDSMQLIPKLISLASERED